MMKTEALLRRFFYCTAQGEKNPRRLWCASGDVTWECPGCMTCGAPVAVRLPNMNDSWPRLGNLLDPSRGVLFDLGGD